MARHAKHNHLLVEFYVKIVLLLDFKIILRANSRDLTINFYSYGHRTLLFKPGMSFLGFATFDFVDNKPSISADMQDRCKKWHSPRPLPVSVNTFKCIVLSCYCIRFAGNGHLWYKTINWQSQEATKTNISEHCKAGTTHGFFQSGSVLLICESFRLNPP